MADVSKYIPVSCDLVDQIEIIATQKTRVVIEYMEDGMLKTQENFLKTWFTRKHVEYLVMQDGAEIRLDQIVRINDKRFNDSCSS